MLAPHLTGNVLVGGDRSSLLIGTDGKDGRADAKDTDVGDGRVALPGGGSIPPAAVGRPDLILWRGLWGKVFGLGMNTYIHLTMQERSNEKEIEINIRYIVTPQGLAEQRANHHQAAWI